MPDRLRGLVLRTGIPQRAWNGAWSPGSLLGIKPYEWLRYNYFVGSHSPKGSRLRGASLPRHAVGTVSAGQDVESLTQPRALRSEEASTGCLGRGPIPAPVPALSASRSVSTQQRVVRESWPATPQPVWRCLASTRGRGSHSAPLRDLNATRDAGALERAGIADVTFPRRCAIPANGIMNDSVRAGDWIVASPGNAVHPGDEGRRRPLSTRARVWPGLDGRLSFGCRRHDTETGSFPAQLLTWGCVTQAAKDDSASPGQFVEHAAWSRWAVVRVSSLIYAVRHGQCRPQREIAADDCRGGASWTDDGMP
ncbi:hypothetical protein Purlil1_726 [Purpureocillium lilacinum]|uniref:Uncharacterized protein n=1 Tax=Purpureocillium lilacinum TaxID=33203 RepID=A0ABR0CFZ5_PURLI|nr:hypothetical protein Purlil1_726 [Purpureocillium lilacinum]